MTRQEGIAVLGDATVDVSQTEALLRTGALQSAIFNSANFSSIATDAKGVIQIFNVGAERMLGYTAGDMVNRITPADISDPQEVIARAKELSIELGTQIMPGFEALVFKASRGIEDIYELTYIRKDRSRFPAVVSVTALRDAEDAVYRDGEGKPQHFISVVEDVTERRTLEAQVRQASKMEAIGLLAAGVAHDFNNLLSVVLSYSELLAADLKDGDPMRSNLEEIKGAGLQAVQLTRQLLAFSRRQVLEPQIVDLTEIVRGMGKMLGRVIGADVQLSVTGDHALGKILVDPGQMEQVIMNLAVNARDAMPRGGKLTLETSAVVLDEASAAKHVGVKPGSHVLLTVKDTGIGMDRATQARMFEPFFTTKEPGKGTGLGLATVFGIVRQSGGAIGVSSEPDAGTVFEIYFPTAQEETVAHVSLRPPELHTLSGSETILLVENEERVRTLACAILRRYGYNVLDAQSSGDAVLICEQHRGTIHLLLSDVVMPRMNGWQLATRLLAVRPQMRVLYMSGYADSAAAHHAARHPGVAFLQKPITPVALALKVRETLGPGAPAPR